MLRKMNKNIDEEIPLSIIKRRMYIKNKIIEGVLNISFITQTYKIKN
jgi:hypothetical protein